MNKMTFTSRECWLDLRCLSEGTIEIRFVGMVGSGTNEKRNKRLGEERNEHKLNIFHKHFGHDKKSLACHQRENEALKDFTSSRRKNFTISARKNRLNGEGSFPTTRMFC